MSGPWRLPLPGDLDKLPRRAALAAEYEAEFGTVGSGPDAEFVVHIPRVRLAPGPRGVRSITVHGESWAEVLDWLEGVIDGGPDG